MNINRVIQLFPHRASCPMWDIAVKYICWLVILVTQNASTRKINGYIKNLNSAYYQFQKEDTFR